MHKHLRGVQLGHRSGHMTAISVQTSEGVYIRTSDNYPVPRIIFLINEGSLALEWETRGAITVQVYVVIIKNN